MSTSSFVVNLKISEWNYFFEKQLLSIKPGVFTNFGTQNYSKLWLEIFELKKFWGWTLKAQKALKYTNEILKRFQFVESFRFLKRTWSFRESFHNKFFFQKYKTKNFKLPKAFSKTLKYSKLSQKPNKSDVISGPSH